MPNNNDPQTIDQLLSKVDQDVTTKTGRRSITPLILGTLLKTIINFFAGFITNNSGTSAQVTRRYKNDTGNPLTMATNGRLLTLKPNTKDIVKLPQTSHADAVQAKFKIPVTAFPKYNSELSNITLDASNIEVGSSVTLEIRNDYANSVIKQEQITCATKFRPAKVKVLFPSYPPAEPLTQVFQIGVNDGGLNPSDGDTIRFLSNDGTFDETYTFRDAPSGADEIQIGVDAPGTLVYLNNFLTGLPNFETAAVTYQNQDHVFAYKWLHDSEDKRYIDAVVVTVPNGYWATANQVNIDMALGNQALEIKAKIDNGDKVLLLQTMWQDVTPHPVISWYDLFHRTYNANTPFGQIFGSSPPQAGAFGLYWFNNGHAALYDVIMNTANGGYSFEYEFDDNSGQYAFIWTTAGAPADDSEAVINVTLDYLTLNVAPSYSIIQTPITDTSGAWIIGVDDVETLNNLKTYLDALTPAYHTTEIDEEGLTITITANDLNYNIYMTSGTIPVIQNTQYDISQLLNYLTNWNNIYQQGLGIGNYQLSHPSFMQTISTNRIKGTVVNVNGNDYKLCSNVSDYIDNVIESYYQNNTILTDAPGNPAKYTMAKTLIESTGIEVNSVGINDGYVSWQFGSQFDNYFGQIEYVTQFVPKLYQLVRETLIGRQVGIDDNTGEVIVSPLTNINEVEIHPEALQFMEDQNIPFEGVNPPAYASGNINDIAESLWLVWDDGYVLPITYIMDILYGGQNENVFKMFNNGAFTPIKGTTNASTKFEVQQFNNFISIMGDN